MRNFPRHSFRTKALAMKVSMVLAVVTGALGFGVLGCDGNVPGTYDEGSGDNGGKTDNGGGGAATGADAALPGGGADAGAPGGTAPGDACSSDADCGLPDSGAWSDCGGFETDCGVTGSQARTVITHKCIDGACATAVGAETQACTRPATDGAICGDTGFEEWSACTGFADVCAETGTQTRGITLHTCGAGTCNAGARAVETRACARDTDGIACGGSVGEWSPCGGFADACDTVGAQYRTVQQQTCGAGSCSTNAWTSEVQACYRAAPPSINQLSWFTAGPPVTREYWSDSPFAECVQIAEAAEPWEHTWWDNYLCSSGNYGLWWTSASVSWPGGHPYCAKWDESSADPHTWYDNWLCSDQDYGLVFVASFAGRDSVLADPTMRCISVDERADPDYWYDNFLCFRHCD